MRKILIALFLCGGMLSAAYGQGVQQQVLGPRQTGVIQDLLGTGPDTLTISGVVYDYGGRTEFFLRGEPFDGGNLEVGMVVRFTVREGSLQTVEILGPNNLIENLDAQGILD